MPDAGWLAALTNMLPVRHPRRRPELGPLPRLPSFYYEYVIVCSAGRGALEAARRPPSVQGGPSMFKWKHCINVDDKWLFD